MNQLFERLKNQFGVVAETPIKPNQYFCTVDRARLVGCITHLRDMEGFKILILITPVDWIEEGLFQLTYLLNNPAQKIDLGVRTFIGRQGDPMESIHHLWGHAATFQREMKEMFGIDFPGSPRVDEPFLLEGWDDIPPMRREFDTKKYAEETYFPRPGRETHDPAQYMKQKLYPDEE